MTDTATVARRAADLIERNGWWRYDFFPALPSGFAGLDMCDRPVCDRPVCAAGALAFAITPHEDPHGASSFTMRGRVWEQFAIWVGRQYGLDLGADQIDSVGWISAWNDAEGRTQAEVVAALRAFADSHEEAQ